MREVIKESFNLLIVDDDPEIVKVTRFALSDYEYQGSLLKFIEADSKASAIEMLQHHPVDIAIIDIILESREAGLELVEYIRESIKMRDMRIIVRTGLADSYPAEDIYFKYDINDYLSKADLSSSRLQLSITSAIRSYVDIVTIKRLAMEQREKDRLLMLQSKSSLLGEMVQAITHQWSQPLAVIKLASDSLLLSEKERTKEEQEDLQAIERMSDYLMATLDDFKQFFHPDKPRTHFYLNDALKKALAIIPQGDIALVNSIGEDIRLYGCINEVVQLFLIFLHNSIDAYRAHLINSLVLPLGIVKIAAYKEGEKIVVIFEDEAGGIGQEVMENIFKKYNSSKGEVGRGVGLYIVKLIVELEFSGTIEACNTQKGAKFTITLSERASEFCFFADGENHPYEDGCRKE